MLTRVLCAWVVCAQAFADDAPDLSLEQLRGDIDLLEQEVDGLCLLQKSAQKRKPAHVGKIAPAAHKPAVYKMPPTYKMPPAEVGYNHVTGNEIGVMWASDAYIMISAALIYAMSIPGLPLLYGGLVQSKHVISTMTQCMAVGPLVMLIWTVIGYSLAFSGDGAFIGNLDQFLLLPTLRDRLLIYHHPYGPLPETIYFTFMGAFAVITPMLIVGAWAERAKFVPAVLFCGLWSLIVYCPLTHWVWGGGWLAQMGVRDFAGGLVVHLSAGSAALTAALMLPSRPGFPHAVGAPHSMPMIITGLGIIWLGWFGFNGASALQAGGQAGMTVVVTQTAAITALLVWLALESARSKPTLESAVCGAIAGLGSITPASGFVGVPGAIIIGIVAALATYLAWYLCKERGWADDALDVWPIHGVGGAVGTLSVAFLSSEALGGVGYAVGVPMFQLLWVQLVGVVTTFIWSAGWSFIFIKVINRTIGFCHGKDVQLTGLDMADHAAEAYDIPASPSAIRKGKSMFGGIDPNSPTRLGNTK